MQLRTGIVVRALFSGLLLLWTIAPASAQFRAGVQGSVTDSSGAVIPGAEVTLKNNDSGQVQKAATSNEGFYHFSGLAPGRYTITASKAEFKTVSLENLRVNAEELQGANLTLDPGTVTETVTVTGENVAALETETANITGQIGTQQVRQLPQIGRDPYELLRLAPGIFGDMSRNGSGLSVGLPNTTGPGGSNSSIFQTENQVPISANGQRISANSFQIDGVSVNSLGFGGAAVVTPNQESVKEIRVSSSSYTAEDGRNTGAQVQVVSQNGTNQFHGSGVFKYNDPALNAFNKYGGPNAPVVRVENKFKQFAGSVGGPIIKNNLFFFFSYEGLRENTTNFATTFTETPQFRQAVIALRPNSLIAKVLSSPGIAPRTTAVINQPCPSGFGANCRQVNGGLDIGSITGAQGQYTTTLGGGLDGIPDIQFVQIALPSKLSGDQYNGRVDYSHGKDTFAVSTYFTTRNDLGSDASGASRPVADVANSPLTSAVTLTYNRVLSPTWLNEARVNFTRFSFNQLTASSATNFGLPRIEIEALPFDRIRFGPPWGETTPGIFAENTYAFRDNISKVAGNHVFRFGVDVTKEQDNNNLVGGARPLYSFTGLFNLANQTPVFEQINANPQNGQPADAQRYFRTSTYAGYMQDSWKVHPNVSVTLGVRYEYFTPLTEKRDQLNNLVFSQGTLADAHVVPVKQLTDPQIHQFTPRFGFAWSPPWGNNKLVMRGGFGMYYNRVPDSLFANTRGNPPNFARFQLCCGTPDTPFDNGQIQFALGSSNSPSSFPVNSALAVGIDPKTGAPLGRSVEIWGAQRNFPNAYAYIYSFAIEYQLPYRLVSEIAYQGSADHHLIRIVNQNFLYPQNPNFFQVFFPQPDVNSDYNSLNLRLTRQFGQGFQLETKYRWSKSMDTLSYEGPGGSTNQTFPQDNHTERGPSDFDATHYLLVSGIYELPWYRKQEGFWGKLLGGFELSGIETAHSGFPWTPKIGQSVSTPGGPTLAPIRPTQYFGGALNDTSNDAFIRPGGNFPGGGAKFFNITASGPPGVGRNSFRGPHYVSTDLSVIKQTRLPASWHMGEAAMIDIRANLYNVFNQLNLTPFNFFSAGTFADNSTLFGRADGGLAGRVVEFQARFSF